MMGEEKMKPTKLNDQADNHADEGGPLWNVGNVKRAIAYVLKVFVSRAVDAIPDERFAESSEEEN